MTSFHCVCLSAACLPFRIPTQTVLPAVLLQNVCSQRTLPKKQRLALVDFITYPHTGPGFVTIDCGDLAAMKFPLLSFMPNSVHMCTSNAALAAARTQG